MILNANDEKFRWTEAFVDPNTLNTTYRRKSKSNVDSIILSKMYNYRVANIMIQNENQNLFNVKFNIANECAYKIYGRFTKQKFVLLNHDFDTSSMKIFPTHFTLDPKESILISFTWIPSTTVIDEILSYLQDFESRPIIMDLELSYGSFDKIILLRDSIKSSTTYGKIVRRGLRLNALCTDYYYQFKDDDRAKNDFLVSND